MGHWGQALEFVCDTLYRHECCIEVTYDSFIVQSVSFPRFLTIFFFILDLVKQFFLHNYT